MWLSRARAAASGFLAMTVSSPRRANQFGGRWYPPNSLPPRCAPDWLSSGNRRLVFGMDQPEPPAAPFAPLMLCPGCATEMRLLGIESENPARDLYTFECAKCGRLEVRGVSTV